MTRAELLQRVNDREVETRRIVLTERMLEDLVYEDLIPGPIRRMGTWDWSVESYEGALKALEYRVNGFHRNDGIRAQWWLDGRDFPLHVVRESLIREFGRAQKLLLRFVSSAHGLRRDINLTAYRRQALIGQLGQLDPEFARRGLGLGSTASLLFYEIARFGEAITSGWETDPVSTMIRGLQGNAENHPLAGLLETDGSIQPSAVCALREEPEPVFKECRAIVCSFETLALFGASLFETKDEGQNFLSQRIEKAFSIWPWRIFSFGAIVNARRNGFRAL